MRIALVTSYPPSTQSLNEYAFHFVRHLRDKPEVSEIILLVDEIDEDYPSSDDNDTPLTFIPCWRFNAINNTRRIVDAVRSCQPDIVMFNIQFATFGDNRIPAALGLLAPQHVKQKTQIPTVVLLHNIMETVDLKSAGFGSNPLIRWVTRQFGNFFTRRILAADVVALTIPKYVEILREKYDAESVLLAPHGAFEEAPPPQFQQTPAEFNIMTFGKFGTYKRVETLIQAYDKLRQNGLGPMKLVVAGADSPNAQGYLAEMQQRFADIPNIEFTGYVAEEDVPRIFNESTVVVFPYTSTTGSSGVLHQAGSYGKAAVLPQLGDFAELIAEEGYTGEFFEPDDPASLADAIRRLLEDTEHRHNIEMQNYLAAHGLPMSDVVDWYVLHFENLLAQASS